MLATSVHSMRQLTTTNHGRHQIETTAVHSPKEDLAPPQSVRFVPRLILLTNTMVSEYDFCG